MRLWEFVHCLGFKWTQRFAWTGFRQMSYSYFKYEEIKGLSVELVAKLDTARRVAGVPFVITSGLRTADANTSAGGVQDSSHLSGKAVDLRCSGNEMRFKMVKGLVQAGFNRIGIYDGHCHADVAEDLPTPRIWIGVSH